MRGNTFILVPVDEKNNNVPTKLKDKWKFTEPVPNENGELAGETTVIHPSWLAAANKLKRFFGVVRELTDHPYLDGDYMLVEFELSHIDGEIQAVEALQSGSSNKYQILTVSEAKRLLKGEDIWS